MFHCRVHWTLFWASWIPSTPSRPIYLRPNLTLSSHLRIGFPSDLFA
jgi:hypothetical protein